ncbi:hypothetical protein WN55_07551 [Dufourea novaeangliae]|uniref:Uncharacterized protein n=1 Tax=Dufourea novaeangliae TaxID=178035 RepID=A0A154P6E9_DUFNO|nr:hypothetical protein WN55_07551 [Dufourea novaeangliae]
MVLIYGECHRIMREEVRVYNLRWLREVDKRRPWSVNVWCGLLHNKITGPYFIDGTLNSRKYQRILKDVLLELLENTSLDVRQSTRYQQDRMSCSFSTKCHRISEQEIWRSLDWSIRK